MIDPKELRIGNLVNTEHGVDEVMSIDHETLEFHAILTKSDHLYIPKHMGVNISCELIDPIPITPEWLERLGFEKERSDRYRDTYCITIPGWDEVMDEAKNDYEYIEFRHHDNPNNEYWFDFDGASAIPCRYVHELQNGFFALQRKELTIKQPEHET